MRVPSMQLLSNKDAMVVTAERALIRRSGDSAPVYLNHSLGG
jgi:hypothetical protein